MERQDVSYIQKVRSLWGVIKKEIRLSDIADHMVENDVLSLDNLEELRTAHITEKERTEKFLFILIQQNNSKHFQVFIDAIRNTGREDLSSQLQPTGTDTNIPNLCVVGHKAFNQAKSTTTYECGAESGYDGSEKSLGKKVIKIEQLMMKLEMMYEQQNSKMDLVLSEQQTARCKMDSVISEQLKAKNQMDMVLNQQNTTGEKMEALMERNERMSNKMENIAAGIDSRFETHHNRSEDYEILRQKHEDLLKECSEKEEELNRLQKELKNQVSDFDTPYKEKYETLQAQLIALKKTNEARVKRLKALNQEIVLFRKRFAKTFHVAHQQHLSDVMDHFESMHDNMKQEIDSLTQKMDILGKDNENLIMRNEKLEEDLINVEKMLLDENQKLKQEKRMLEEELSCARKKKEKRNSKGRNQDKNVPTKAKDNKCHCQKRSSENLFKFGDPKP